MKVGILGSLGLSSSQRADLDARALAGYPHEVCGLLIGNHGGGRTCFDRIVGCRNLAGERLADRYELDPDDFLAADAAARDDGLEIVGIWHTHPDHPARPSPTDREAAWPGYTYLIIAVDGEGARAYRAWRLDGTEFVEQEIVTT